MFISEIRIMRKKNLGNFEHKEVGVTIALTLEDDCMLAYDKGETFIMEALSGVKVAPVKETVAEVVAVKEEAPKKTVKKSKKKVEQEEIVISKDELNKLLIDVAKLHKSKEKAISLIMEVGNVESLSDLPEDKYSELAKLCMAALNG